MSDRKTLVVATAIDAAEASACLAALERVNIPDAAKYVVTNGKLETRGIAKSFNIESGYPAEPPHLQTLAAWAEIPTGMDERFRDGIELFGLKVLLERAGEFDLALLLRSEIDGERGWVSATHQVRNRLFHTFQGSKSPDVLPGRWNVLFQTGDSRFAEFLDLAWELFETGAAYGVSPYRLDEVLTGAAHALQ